MKCPRRGCGNEVARLIQSPSTAVEYPEGLCVTCHAVEQASEGQPLSATRQQPTPQPAEPAPRPRRPAAPQTESAEPPRIKRKYVRKKPFVPRNKTAAAPPSAPAVTITTPRMQSVEHEPVPTQIGLLEKIRLGYADEVKLAERALKLAQDNLRIATEILLKVGAAQQ